MSKRSHLSLLGDLQRGFLDIGRYRYILHKIDMEPWRGKFCPICNKEFTEEPRFRFMSYDMHIDCTFTPAYDVWMNDWYANNTYDFYQSMDDAYNELVLSTGLEE